VRILLARPRPDRRSINLQRFMISEPLELEIVAAHLQSLGHTVDLVDLILERRPLTWFVKQETYDIVGLTGYINHVQVVKQLARDVKAVSPRTTVVVGGVHAEVVPTDFVDPAIDHILWANGAVTLGEIASAECSADAAVLPGVWGSGKIRPTAVHPKGMFPNREITAKYRDRYNYIYHDHCATLKTSYGCPFTCRFCFCTQVAPYAERDLDEVMDELEQIVEDHVFIVDDDFLSRPYRIKAFCEALDARGIHKRFIAFGRADYVVKHPDDITLLAAHGLDALFVGIESFRADDLADYDKRVSVEQNVKAVRVLEAAGVQCYAGLITGEDWGPADFDGLADFLNQFEHPMVNIQPITPMPGTPLYDEEADRLSLPRARSERWDMAHLAFRPTALSPRAYYWQLLKTYYRTSASRAQRRYVLQRYGPRVYRRVLRGALGITWQYLTLIVRPE
jgi:hopanoid C-3 methylase